MKIWACAKDSNGFINRADGRYKLFYIWQALKIKREDPHHFNQLTFYSTHSREHLRIKMSPVKSGFFRYENGKNNRGGGDSESLSHSLAIAVLSQLQTINFKLGNEMIPFNFTSLLPEEVELSFGNGHVYRPDIMGYFTEDNPFFHKWGGKVAIEVKVTHACEPAKIVDFRNHGIAIIEVSISEKLRIERFLDHNNIEESLSQKFQYLSDLFRKQVYGRILSDPISPQYYNEKIATLTHALQTNQLDQEKLKDKLDTALKTHIETHQNIKNELLETETKLANLGNVIKQKNLQIIEAKKEIVRLSDQLTNEKSLSIWKRIFRSKN